MRLAILALLLSACGGGHTQPAAPKSSLELQTLTSATGRYSIQLPKLCQPAISGAEKFTPAAEIGPQQVEGHTVYNVACNPPFGGAIFAVLVESPAALDEPALRALGYGFVDAWRKDASIERDEPVTVGKFTGRELHFQINDRAHVARVLWNPTAVLVVVALSTNVNPAVLNALQSATLIR